MWGSKAGPLTKWSEAIAPPAYRVEVLSPTEQLWAIPPERLNSWSCRPTPPNSRLRAMLDADGILEPPTAHVTNDRIYAYHGSHRLGWALETGQEFIVIRVVSRRFARENADL